MRVGLIKRAGAFLFDAIPIIFFVSLLLTWFVGDLLEPEGYDDLMVEYEEIREDYNDLIEPHRTQYDDGDITEDEYQVILDDILVDFYADTEVHTESMYMNLIMVIFHILYCITYITSLLKGKLSVVSS